MSNAMGVGLAAGFGDVLGYEHMADIRAHGFDIIRQDISTVQGRHPDTYDVINEDREWTAQGGRMLYITDLTTLPLVPPGSWVELLNEPEYLTPVEYGKMLWDAWPTVRSRGLTLWAGCIGNLDRDSLGWLRQVVEVAPFITHVSVHRYAPDVGQTPSKAHRGFRDRDAEVAELRAVIGDRPFIVSEVGYSTAARRRWWFFMMRLSPREQANRLRMELEFWRAHGAAAVCIYQENDAPEANSQDQYGLRFADGRWKTETNYGVPL